MSQLREGFSSVDGLISAANGQDDNPLASLLSELPLNMGLYEGTVHSLSKLAGLDSTGMDLAAGVLVAEEAIAEIMGTDNDTLHAYAKLLGQTGVAIFEQQSLLEEGTSSLRGMPVFSYGLYTTIGSTGLRTFQHAGSRPNCLGGTIEEVKVDRDPSGSFGPKLLFTIDSVVELCASDGDNLPLNRPNGSSAMVDANAEGVLVAGSLHELRNMASTNKPI